MNHNSKLAKDRIILALDVDTKEQARELVVELKDYVGTFKVGLQLFTSVGPDIFKIINEEGGRIFFDGKFHDIPNTVARSCANVIKNGVNFFNLHIQGGSKMLSSSVKLSKETAKKMGVEKPTILGITLLSSFGQRTLTEELCVKTNITDYVSSLALVAQEAGLDGVVADASDAKKIRQVCGEDFIILCPAIRPTWSIVNDQVRVVTPTDAIRANVDYMVIGRPITSATDRIAATQLILDEIDEALKYAQEDCI